jgi:ribosome biogenesis GTPase A
MGQAGTSIRIETKQSDIVSLLPTPKTTEAGERFPDANEMQYAMAPKSQDSVSGDSDVGELPGDEEDAEPNIKDFNILLLGGPNVGKSTVFKQLQMIYGSGFSDDQVGVAKRQVVLQVSSAANDCLVAFGVAVAE